MKIKTNKILICFNEGIEISFDSRCVGVFNLLSTSTTTINTKREYIDELDIFIVNNEYCTNNTLQELEKLNSFSVRHVDVVTDSYLHRYYTMNDTTQANVTPPNNEGDVIVSIHTDLTPISFNANT